MQENNTLIRSLKRNSYVYRMSRMLRMLRTSDVKRRASRNGSNSKRAQSWGSFIQPSMGMPFSVWVFED